MEEPPKYAGYPPRPARTAFYDDEVDEEYRLDRRRRVLEDEERLELARQRREDIQFENEEQLDRVRDYQTRRNPINLGNPFAPRPSAERRHSEIPRRPGLEAPRAPDSKFLWERDSDLEARQRQMQLTRFVYPPGWEAPWPGDDVSYPQHPILPPLLMPPPEPAKTAELTSDTETSHSSAPTDLEAPSQPFKFIGRAFEDVNAIHRTQERSKDISVRLELDIEDDLSDELEELGRFCRLGHFEEAKHFFREKLMCHVEDPFVFVLYGSLLYEAGDLASFSNLTPEAAIWDSITPTAATLLRVNWELLSFLGQGPNILSPGRLLDVVSDTIEFIRSSKKWGSTEIQILCLAMSCIQVLNRSGRFNGQSAGALQKFHSTLAQMDWRGAYDHLLQSGSIWDFRDLFVSLVAFQGWETIGESFLGKQTAAAILDKMLDDWQGYTYDGATALALLDTVSTCILQDSAPSIPINKTRTSTFIAECLEVARSLAMSVTRHEPQQMKSRPFIQWILSQAILEQTRSDLHPFVQKNQGSTSPGLLLPRRHGVHLPVYVPRDIENPGWSAFTPKSTSIEGLLTALQTCRELEDYNLEAICLRLIILKSSEPRKYMNILLERQKSVFHDKFGYLQTLLSGYLLATTSKTQKKLLGEIVGTNFEQDRLDIPGFEPDLRDYILVESLDPTILWARNMLIAALRRNLGLSSQTNTIMQYFSRLPRSVRTYITLTAPWMEVPTVEDAPLGIEASIPAHTESASTVKQEGSLIVEEILSDKDHHTDQKAESEPAVSSPSPPQPQHTTGMDIQDTADTDLPGAVHVSPALAQDIAPDPPRRRSFIAQEEQARRYQRRARKVRNLDGINEKNDRDLGSASDFEESPRLPEPAPDPEAEKVAGTSGKGTTKSHRKTRLQLDGIQKEEDMNDGLHDESDNERSLIHPSSLQAEGSQRTSFPLTAEHLRKSAPRRILRRRNSFEPYHEDLYEEDPKEEDSELDHNSPQPRPHARERRDSGYPASKGVRFNALRPSTKANLARRFDRHSVNLPVDGYDPFTAEHAYIENSAAYWDSYDEAVAIPERRALRIESRAYPLQPSNLYAPPVPMVNDMFESEEPKAEEEAKDTTKHGQDVTREQKGKGSRPASKNRVIPNPFDYFTGIDATNTQSAQRTVESERMAAPAKQKAVRIARERKSDSHERLNLGSKETSAPAPQPENASDIVQLDIQGESNRDRTAEHSKSVKQRPEAGGLETTADVSDASVKNTPEEGKAPEADPEKVPANESVGPTSEEANKTSEKESK